jgi:alpha-1,2-mannosyltransferase
VAYVVLCSSVVFLWRFDASGVDGLLGGSAFLWVSVGLLVGLPTGHPARQRSAVPVSA